jgi:adenosylcobyric acid synthase
MIQGTASHVGKSLLVAGLCRILAQDGYRVAPFKAQNMALNSFVAAEGGEIGRAQAVQAWAARVTPTVDMNPILLKPSNDTDAQVIVLGRPVGTFSAATYGRDQIPLLRRVVREAYERLAAQYEVVVIEGAGSPAEVNLRDRDLTNMDVAEMAEAPVLLVGDIDRGGVFAALVGTLELLDPPERDRVQGFIVNKFRGDRHLLAPGLDFLVARTGKPVFGVIPFDRDLCVPEEDALPERAFANGAPGGSRRPRLGVVLLPHLSNFTDFDPLAVEPDLELRYVVDPGEIAGLDGVILPGSKSTVADLHFLRERGLAEAITRAAARGKLIVGVCGGYQMLGAVIADPDHVESGQQRVSGLGLLRITTRFQKEKVTHQVRATCLRSGEEVRGYEIHHGVAIPMGGTRPAFEIVERSGQAVRIHDGAHDGSGNVWGSHIHGLFDNDVFRHQFVSDLCERIGRPGRGRALRSWSVDRELDRWAEALRAHLDVSAIYRLLEGEE